MLVANLVEEGKLGGPQVRMVRVAAALSDNFKTVILMPEKNSSLFRGMCEGSGVEYVLLPINTLRKDALSLLVYCFFWFYEIAKIKRVLVERGFDVLHVSGGSWQVKGVVAAKLAGVPVVWHLNDTSMPRIIRLMFRLFSRMANGFIFASYRSKEYYQDVSGDRPFSVISSLVDSQRFNPDIEQETDASVFSKIEGRTVIGTVANINPVKGFEMLIDAFSLLCESRDDVVLLVVGPIHGNQQSYYERLQELAKKKKVSEKIIWAGGRSDVRPLLSVMDIYACSSLAESSPVSVWEAMAMRKAIVSTDVGDVPRHIRDGVNGFVVPVGDASAMAKRFSQLLSDEDLRDEFGIKARIEAIDCFSPKNVADKTQDIYQRVIS